MANPWLPPPRVCMLLGVGLLLMTVLPSLGQQSEGKSTQKSPEQPFGTPPLIRLIRDPHTQSELKLSASQIKSVEELLVKIDSPLWRIRDYPTNKVSDQAKPLLAEFEAGLKKNLDERQVQRLKQIVRQVQSWRGIVEGDFSRELGLTNEQMEKLRALFEESSKKQVNLQQESKLATDKSPESISQSLREIQEKERDQVANILDSRQRQKLTELVGTPFEFSKLKHLWTKAPEFAQGSDWVQSRPLKLADQRGKVTVVHFFAFGCINCIHNYPWYRKWSEKYSSSEVAIIGIHTPETTAEESVSTLERKLKENQLTFPVLVDNNKKNWAAWGNNMWPSVYVIDKEGYVRAWWYGELDWQGAGGHKILSQRIDELLKEAPR
jgi:peroxiredoxin